MFCLQGHLISPTSNLAVPVVYKLRIFLKHKLSNTIYAFDIQELLLPYCPVRLAPRP
jgi:hypothetical protein